MNDLDKDVYDHNSTANRPLS